VARHVGGTGAVGRDFKLLLVAKAKIRTNRGVREGSHRRRGELCSLGIAVRMIRVPVCIDDVRDPQSLILQALDERFGRVRRVNQHALVGVPVPEHVA